MNTSKKRTVKTQTQVGIGRGSENEVYRESPGSGRKNRVSQSEVKKRKARK
jgi:hypothetical protein